MDLSDLKSSERNSAVSECNNLISPMSPLSFPIAKKNKKRAGKKNKKKKKKRRKAAKKNK